MLQAGKQLNRFLFCGYKCWRLNYWYGWQTLIGVVTDWIKFRRTLLPAPQGRPIPFLSDWVLPCSAVVWRLALWLVLVGTVLLRLVRSLLALASFGPWFWIVWYLVMFVSCCLLLIARQPLSIWLGLAVCCLCTMAFSLTIFGGGVVISGVFSLGCVLPGILALQICCRRTLFLLLLMVLALEDRVVVVYWVLA